MASWTDVGDEEGLDPLAMASPVENLYMRLLPGFSTITTRLRQYAFHAWWITDYADRVRVPSRATFAEGTRRVEWLYALVNAASEEQEYGAAGINRAREALATGTDPLDLETPTSLDTPANRRYLQPTDGDFRGTYFGQMREMGLLGEGAKHKLPVPTPLGRRLAEAFGASVGASGGLFLEIAQERAVARTELAALSAFRLSALPLAGEERLLLRRLLLGEEQLEAGAAERSLPKDRRTLSDDLLQQSETRGRTLRAILDAARLTGEVPSQDMLRWYWLERAPDGGADPTVMGWRHYQAGDTVRVVYEALLRRVVDTLEDFPVGVPMSQIGGLVCRDLSDDTLGTLAEAFEQASGESSMRELQARALSEPERLEEILAPLARLLRMWAGRVGELEMSFPPSPGRQSAASELSWLEARQATPGRDALAELIGERVVRRHFHVARRKLSRQGNYTFLFDVENGRIWARLKRPVSPSGPRLTTALRFLSDAGLLQDGSFSDEELSPS